ncbi:hypothetical protein PENSPDRAFT_595681 [Peniophora sp. CONT]|nr:hypothetical protein PENSPDRAFT_595681 [Peniophora sp. CONT]
MSDSIVLWRLYAVWDRARSILAFGLVLLITTFALNVANIVAEENPFAPFVNDQDSEDVMTYGRRSVGLAAAFFSLASNMCATALVGLKIWLHRRRFPMHVRCGSRRTMVERVMELLVDSGVVYTAIWVSSLVHLFAFSSHVSTSSYTVSASITR